MHKIKYLPAIFIVLLLMNLFWKVKQSWRLTNKYDKLDYIYFSIRLLVFFLLVYPEDGWLGDIASLLSIKYSESYFVLIIFALGTLILAMQNIHSLFKTFVSKRKKNEIRKNWLTLFVMGMYMVLFRNYANIIDDYLGIFLFSYWIVLYYIDEKY